MAEFDDIPRIPYTFRGGLAFNQRTVAAAVATLLGESENGAHLAGRPLPIGELANVLLLLESVAMADGMYLDGTLPPGDIDRLQNSIWRVAAQADAHLTVEFLRPSSSSLVSMFQESAESATLLMADGLDRLRDQSDPPMGGDIQGFVSAIQDAAADATGRVGACLAQQIAEAAAEGRETFRGSKCVAGIVLANQEAPPLLQRANDLLRSADDATQRKAVAVLINRFRINYVNSLAGLRDAAYLADAAIEGLKAAQVVLFCRYLASKISESHVQALSANTQKLFDQELQAVPLGFAILMNARGRSAVELLREALEVRALGFGPAAARAMPQDRHLHQLTDEGFGQFREYLFKSDWARLMNDAERSEFMPNTWRSLYIPAGLGGVVGVIAGGVLAGPAGPAGAVISNVLGSLAGTLAHILGDGVVKGTLASRRLNVDHYRRMDRYLALAVKNDRIHACAERVHALFGRPLLG
jgi:hypothetical protein